MIKRIWAYLTGGRLVWLKDYDGEVTLAIAKINPWGEITAERQWPFNIHTVCLLPDGTIEGWENWGEYVYKWKYVYPDKYKEKK